MDDFLECCLRVLFSSPVGKLHVTQGSSFFLLSGNLVSPVSQRFPFSGESVVFCVRLPVCSLVVLGKFVVSTSVCDLVLSVFEKFLFSSR